MKTLKEFLTEYAEKKGWDQDNDILFEILEDMDTVCEDEYDEHRWYIRCRVVKTLYIDGDKRYFEYYDVNPKGEDTDREDCGWEVPDIDSIREVFPRQVMTTIYE